MTKDDSLPDRSPPQQARRRFRLIVFYLVLLAPWITKGAMSALQPTANSPLDWVDAEFEPRREYDRFAAQFVAGDVVVISWPECILSNSRLDDFTRSLRQSRGFYENGNWMFDRIVSGRDALRQFTSPPMSLSQLDAKRRISRSLHSISPC